MYAVLVSKCRKVEYLTRKLGLKPISESLYKIRHYTSGKLPIAHSRSHIRSKSKHTIASALRCDFMDCSKAVMDYDTV